MAIIRTHKRENPYLIVDKTCANDDRISFKAKGIHTYLCGKPEDWEVNITHLSKVSTDGRDSVISGLDELFDFGYAYKELYRISGKFASDYDVYELQTDNPHYMKLVETFHSLTQEYNITDEVISNIANKLKKPKYYIEGVVGGKLLPSKTEMENISKEIVKCDKIAIPTESEKPLRENRYGKTVTENPLLLINELPINDLLNNELGFKDIVDDEKTIINEEEKPPIEPEEEKPNKYSEDSQEYKLTCYLIDRIKKNNPRQPTPEKNINSLHLRDWIDEIDRLHRLGPLNGNKGYSYEEIKALIDFSQSDPFWFTNILSARKLREKIVTLENKMNSSYMVPDKKKKTGFHNFESRVDNYTEEEIEDVARRKREEKTKESIEHSLEDIIKRIEELREIYGDNILMIISALKRDNIYDFAKDNKLL